MELKDLVGERLLSGVEMATEKTNDRWSTEDANVITFIIDGVTYKATEDPNDGYRSSLREIEVVNTIIKNTFEPQRVIGTMKADSSYQQNDTIEFTDLKSGLVVLEIGTDNYDDYYPCCVMSWIPENLSINNPTVD